MFTENTEELAQNKLLLLYIIKKASYSFTKEELTEFILSKEYMNYFLIQQYLLELLESGFIEIDNSQVEKIQLLEKGNVALELFEAKISQNLKEDLELVFKSEQIIKKKEAQIVSEYFQTENKQFTVNLKLIENEQTLFSLYLNVGSVSQAESICSTWENNPEKIYQGIVNMFIND